MISIRCLLVILLCPFLGHCLEYDMVAQTKCIMEEIGENIIVLGEYSGYKKADGGLVPLDVKVRAALQWSLCIPGRQRELR